MKDLIIVIPVYNEEENIDVLIKDWINVLPKSSMDLLFLDDDSQDKSKEIINNYQKYHENILLINKKNSGHGHTILQGYKYAIENRYKLVMQIDSDNQFSSADFNLIWSQKDLNYDLILGNRKKRNDPLLRVFLSKVILRILILFLYFKDIKDANIPYRLIRVEMLRRYLNKLDFIPVAPNLLMSIYINKIKYIDIRHFQRKYGDVSWPILKLLKFSIKLLKELISFRLKLNK